MKRSQQQWNAGVPATGCNAGALSSGTPCTNPWLLWRTQGFLQEGSALLAHLAKPGARALTQQLSRAALELLPALLAGASALLKEVAACDHIHMYQENFHLASATVVCATWLCVCKHIVIVIGPRQETVCGV